MAIISAPLLIYQSQRRRDDYRTDDMRSGDLDTLALRDQLRLCDVSAQVDPYTMQKSEAAAGCHPAFMGLNYRPQVFNLGAKVCSRILFDEMRQLSSQFSWSCGYRGILSKLISHMQRANGKPYRDRALDYSFRDNILNRDALNPVLASVRKTLTAHIDWQAGKLCNNVNIENKFREGLNKTLLPAYSRWHDLKRKTPVILNDTWATEITLESLNIKNGHFTALLSYQLQGHFGLSTGDMQHFNGNNRFFRLWYVLQRYEKFGFKPFVINIKTTAEVTGKRPGSIQISDTEDSV
ncbi:DUF3289 family protein [Morganella psychrotolerans]|uniref:DUF3289 family protein n=1 Tax=Morganella psychrotolerans TaxID=368603 RepID=UPI0039AFFF05